MAEEAFRLPGSPYEVLVNIIVAYGTRDEAAGPGDISKLDAAHLSSASRNNAFLAHLGILQGETKRIITEQGRDLALALGRRDREGIRQNWRKVVSTSEFMQNIVSAVKMREGMMRTTLQSYIAQAAKQPKNKPVMNGAGAIIDILRAAGLLREEDGMIRATFDGEADLPEFTQQEVSESARVSVSAGENPAVNIHLHVRCDADEIEDLAPKLKALLRELSDPLP